MSQHDGVIANDSGQAVRNDLNNALAALWSNHSGTTEPTTKYAYQWWADTTTGKLKIRNAANNAWIEVGSLSLTNLGFAAPDDMPRWAGSAGGTGNALTLTPAQPITSYVNQTFFFKATASNSAAATVAVSGLTAKSIKLPSGASLGAGDITSGQIYVITYDGTNFVLINPVGVMAARTVKGNNSTSTSAPADLTMDLLKRLIYIPPIQTSYLTGGASGTHLLRYAFVCAPNPTVTPTAGATYTHNGITYTVVETRTVSGTGRLVIYASGLGEPITAGGTLTKSAGTGDSTITFSDAHTPKEVRVRLVGAGGGGAGSGTAGTMPAGTSGGNTTFGSSLLTANGGAVAGSNSTAGSGGSASIGSGAFGIAINGAAGSGGQYTSGGTPALAGGMGGVSPLGGAGNGGSVNNVGGNAAANSGSGGGGGNSGTTGGVYSGGAGGAGGFVDATIQNGSTAWASSFAYAVGSKGTKGGAGTSGFAGGDGADGGIWVEERY